MTMLKFLVVILLLVFVNKSQGQLKIIDACQSELTYEDILKSINLPNCTSCNGRCGSTSSLQDKLPCSCDPLCSTYGDCCLDFTETCPSEANRDDNVVGKPSCEMFGNLHDMKYLVISSCNRSKLACIRSLDSEKAFVPVYDPIKRLHYTNYNCAKCNRATRVQPWDTEVRCKKDVLQNMGYSFGRQSINSTDFEDVWSLIRNKDCFVFLSAGAKMEPPRACLGYVAQRTCQKECLNQELHKRCASDHLMYLHNNHGTFANLACMLCTGHVIIRYISCDTKYTPKARNIPSKGMVSLQLLFDLNNRQGVCSPDEIWVAKEERCRTNPCGTSKCQYYGSLLILNAMVSNNSMSETWLEVTERDLEDVLSYAFESYEYSAMTPGGLELISVIVGFGAEYQTDPDEVTRIVEEFMQLTMGADYIKTLDVHVQNKTTCQANVALYDSSEFKFGFNGTIIIKERIVTPGEYYIVNSSAHVCFTRPMSETGLLPMDIVTIVFISISIICLIIRIIFHYIFPTESDKVAVRLQLSLCVALLIAFSSFLLRLAAQKSEQFCYFLAVVCHWSFLSAFSWMTVIAIDIVRMLRNSLLLRKVGSRKKSFVVYSLFAWGAPLVIIALSVGLNHSYIPPIWKPNYIVKCWISGNGLLVLFVLPAALLFLINIISFMASTFWLCRYHEDSVSKEYKPLKSRLDLVLHLKILALMGITWVFGFLAAPLSQEWMWYIFTFLNGCQGVFLLVVYMLSKGVKKSLMDRTRTWGSRTASTSSRSNNSINNSK